MDEQEIFDGGVRDERDMVLGDDADYAFSPQMGFLKIDRQRMERERIMRLGDVLGMFLFVYLLLRMFSGGSFQLFQNLLSRIAGGNMPAEVQYVLSWLFYMVLTSGVLLIPFFVYAAYLRMPARVAVPLRRPRISLTVLGALVTASVSFMVSLAVSLMTGALKQWTGVVVSIPSVTLGSDPVYFLLHILQLVVVPAVTEELVFRGVIMQSLRQFSDWFALLVSSMLFALIHPSVANLPHAFISGMLIGYFVLRTGSIFTGMFIHGFYNLLSVLLELLLRNVSGSLSTVAYFGVLVLLMILGLAALVTLAKNYDDLFVLNRRKGAQLSTSAQFLTLLKSPPFFLACGTLLCTMLSYVHLV